MGPATAHTYYNQAVKRSSLLTRIPLDVKGRRSRRGACHIMVIGLPLRSFMRRDSGWVGWFISTLHIIGDLDTWHTIHMFGYISFSNLKEKKPERMEY